MGCNPERERVFTVDELQGGDAPIDRLFHIRRFARMDGAVT